MSRKGLRWKAQHQTETRYEQNKMTDPLTNNEPLTVGEGERLRECRGLGKRSTPLELAFTSMIGTRLTKTPNTSDTRVLVLGAWVFLCRISQIHINHCQWQTWGFWPKESQWMDWIVNWMDCPGLSKPVWSGTSTGRTNVLSWYKCTGKRKKYNYTPAKNLILIKSRSSIAFTRTRLYLFVLALGSPQIGRLTAIGMKTILYGVIGPLSW
jgi:hypothetical protein